MTASEGYFSLPDFTGLKKGVVAEFGSIVTVPTFQVDSHGFDHQKGQVAGHVSINHRLASPDQCMI